MLPCQTEPEAWFSVEPADIERAKDECLDCPLSRFNACRAAGWSSEFGVFGALSADDRRAIDPERMAAVTDTSNRVMRAETWQTANPELVQLTREGLLSVEIGRRLGKSKEAVRQAQMTGRKLGVLA